MKADDSKRITLSPAQEKEFEAFWKKHPEMSWNNAMKKWNLGKKKNAKAGVVAASEGRLSPNAIPKDYEVQPLKPGQQAKDKATCNTCGLSWDDGISTSMTPTPSARCPFEAFHKQPGSKKNVKAGMVTARQDRGFVENFPEMAEQLKEAVAAVAEQVAHEDETSGIREVEEVEHKSRDGFISSNDGGYEFSDFVPLEYFFSTGKFDVPAKAKAGIQSMYDAGLEMAKDQFKKDHKAELEGIEDDKINYHDLEEMGKGDLATELEELERSMNEDDTVMFQVRAFMEADEGLEGEIVWTVQGAVNWESPYHRSKSAYEDYKQLSVEFKDTEDMKANFGKVLEAVKTCGAYLFGEGTGGKGSASVQAGLREGYTFTDKEGQISALAEFIDELTKGDYEYATQHEDSGQNYLDAMMDSITVDNLLEINMSRNELWQPVKDALAAGLSKEEITEILKSLVKPQASGVFYPLNTVSSTGQLGETETQLSGIEGEVNGEKISDVFEALKAGLTPEELKKAARECNEAYWDAEKKYSYGNADYDTWMFVVDKDELVDALNEKLADEGKTPIEGATGLNEVWDRLHIYDQDTPKVGKPWEVLISGNPKGEAERQANKLFGKGTWKWVKSDNLFGGYIQDKEGNVIEVAGHSPVSSAVRIEATGESDGEYDHEAYDKICNALKEQGFEATHREFDKYQGVYIDVFKDSQKIDRFWTVDSFLSGETKQNPAVKYKKAVLIDENGDEVSANRGDYFQLAGSDVMEGCQLILTDKAGNEQVIEEPMVSQLPDLLEVSHGVEFTGQPDEVFMLKGEKMAEMDDPIAVVLTAEGEVVLDDLVEYLNAQGGSNG